MSTQAAFSDAVPGELERAGYAAATSELDKAEYKAFKERRWVPALMFFVDVVAIEAALYLGYLIRYMLTTWWPIYLGPSSYEGLILGVLVVPVAYYLVGLHPGYGVSNVEHFRRRLTVTISVFAMLMASLIIDVLTALIDPRVRLGEK